MRGAGDRWAAVRARSLGAAAGIVADRLTGEPPDGVHPVARFGRAMVALERRWWRDSRSAGARYTAAGVGTAAVAGLGVVLATPRRRQMAGRVVSTAVSSSLMSSGRSLGEAAAAVQAALDAGDIEAARAALPALVGRDPSGLDAGEIARAAVESVAENTVDAVVAPILWACAGGGPGAFAYRAANTLDAMVGHHDERLERFGWASARFDDVMNLVPARVTALLVVLARPTRASAVLRVVRRDAGAHPSPNAGVAEAAFAAALDLRLGGENRYGDRVEVRPDLGDGERPTAADIARAVALSRDVSFLLAAWLAAPAALHATRRLRTARRRRGAGRGAPGGAP